jgi:hypothetical protein
MRIAEYRVVFNVLVLEIAKLLDILFRVRPFRRTELDIVIMLISKKVKVPIETVALVLATTLL